MTLDQYQLCPCGSGKKIKFCCSRDFLHDLDRIQRMVQGDQRLAALEKTDALLGKFPDRPSLLMTKAEIELQLDEPQKVRTTVERLLQVDPQNPSAHAMRALLAVLLDGQLGAGIDSIQDAFEAADGIVTARMFDAIAVLARALLQSGMPAAAKGHLQLAVALSDAKDETTSQALVQLNQSRNVPLVLREPWSLLECPESVTWKIEFQAAMREVYRGRWRSGAKQLEAMSVRILDAPAILFNLGVLQAWLGKSEAAVRSFRQYARIRDVPLDDRVQAEAIAEALDPDPTKFAIDLVERTYELAQVDPVMERCLSSRTLTPVPLDREALAEVDQPLPRAVYDIIDRPMPSQTQGLQVGDIPVSWGTLMVYGKETDRPARLVSVCPRTHLASVEDVCRSVSPEPLAEPAEQVVSRTPRFNSEVFASWRFPEGLALDEQRRLQTELRRHALLERWATAPSPLLDGKCPAEAATQSQFKVPLLAMLLNLENMGRDASWEVDFNALRRQLQLPERQPIDAASVNLDRLPVHRFCLLDFHALDDEQLLIVYRRAYAVMAVASLRRIALEVISRRSLDDRIDKVEAYDILSDVAPTTDEALEYLSKARKLATAEGESPAAWLIDELEIRLLRQEFDQFVNLLKEIQSRYIKEPGVAPSLISVLSRYGLVTPDGKIMIPVPRDSALAAQAGQGAGASSGGLWTPEGEATPAPEGGSSPSESKLWIPGMD